MDGFSFASVRRNYIGIERYSSVLLRALERFDNDEEYKDVNNIRFICMDATNLPEVFAVGEIDKIYLNFSDPWPKARHAKRRLTSKQFFERYDKILAFDGVVEFKTDNRELFDFSLEQVSEETVLFPSRSQYGSDSPDSEKSLSWCRDIWSLF